MQPKWIKLMHLLYKKIHFIKKKKKLENTKEVYVIGSRNFKMNKQYNGQSEKGQHTDNGR